MIVLDDVSLNTNVVAALSAALTQYMPEGCTWSEPTGGMFTWLRLPEGMDARELRPVATAAGVAYVPGRPFYVNDEGANEIRLSSTRSASPLGPFGCQWVSSDMPSE